MGLPHGEGSDAADTAVDAAIDAAFDPTFDPAHRITQQLALHPGLWRASQIGGAPGRITASGFAALDAQLPGGGWPHGVLTELLLPQAGVGELRLLSPALAAVCPLAEREHGAPIKPDEGRCVMLFDPPAALSAWGLVQCGISSRHWLVVQARAGRGRAAAPGHAGALGAPATPAASAASAPHTTQHGAPRSANRLSPLLASADLLWALEQALKSGHLGAILAWLPLNLGADSLRRLQLAAQAHDGPVFIFRDAQARSKPSPAPLRLLLHPAGVDGLSVRLLKRRGPPLAQPLRLVLPSALTPSQQAQVQARDLVRQASSVMAFEPGSPRAGLAVGAGADGGADDGADAASGSAGRARRP